jgi:hypothetical protein
MGSYCLRCAKSAAAIRKALCSTRWATGTSHTLCTDTFSYAPDTSSNRLASWSGAGKSRVFSYDAVGNSMVALMAGLAGAVPVLAIAIRLLAP